MSTDSGMPDAPFSVRALRIDADWPLLCQQIGDLSRAGVPLPLALRTSAASAASEPQSRVLQAIADRLDNGIPLPQAVQESGLPNVATIASALEAGHQTSDLYAVLEPLSVAEQRRAELTSRLRQSLVYPYIVIGTGFIFATFILAVAYRWFESVGLDAGYDPRIPGMWICGALVAVPVACVVIATVEVVRSWIQRRVPFSGVGPIRSINQHLSYYAFFSHLGILVDHDVPLPDAVEIAGAASGEPLAAAAVGLANSLRQGKSVEEVVHQLPKAPQLVRTMLSSLAASQSLPSESRGDSYSTSSNSLGVRLHDLATMLHDVIDARISRFHRFQTVWIALILGIGVLGYALLLFWPMTYAYSQNALDPSVLD